MSNQRVLESVIASVLAGLVLYGLVKIFEDEEPETIYIVHPNSGENGS